MKRQKRKIPLMLKLLRTLFPILEGIAPGYAKRLGTRLFFTPFRFPFKEEEIPYMEKAKKFKLDFKGQELAGYAWGDGPTIIFVHGWGGRASQFYSFIDPLLEQGFRVVSLDLPAHGKSPGKQTNIIEMSEALKLLSDKAGDMVAAITHSFGGPISILAASKGWRPEKLVCINMPSNAPDLIKEYLLRINGSPKVGQYIVDYVQEKYNRSFDEFSAQSIANSISDVKSLFVHDKDDKEVNYRNSEEMHRLVPGSELKITEGLGHSRILRDPGIIDYVVEFIAGRVG